MAPGAEGQRPDGVDYCRGRCAGQNRELRLEQETAAAALRAAEAASGQEQTKREKGEASKATNRVIDRRAVAARIAQLIEPYQVDVVAADRWLLSAFEMDAEAAGLAVHLEPFGQGS